jgi:hypothetical protein
MNKAHQLKSKSFAIPDLGPLLELFQVELIAIILLPQIFKEEFRGEVQANYYHYKVQANY